MPLLCHAQDLSPAGGPAIPALRQVLQRERGLAVLQTWLWVWPSELAQCNCAEPRLLIEELNKQTAAQSLLTLLARLTLLLDMALPEDQQILHLLT